MGLDFPEREFDLNPDEFRSTALSDTWAVMDGGSGEATLSTERLESGAVLITAETDDGGMAAVKLDEAKARKLADTIDSHDEEE